MINHVPRDISTFNPGADDVLAKVDDPMEKVAAVFMIASIQVIVAVTC
jgi:hypothetical protein